MVQTRLLGFVWKLGNILGISSRKFLIQEFGAYKITEGRENRSVQIMSPWLLPRACRGCCFLLMVGNNMKPWPGSRLVHGLGLDSSIKSGCCRVSVCSSLCLRKKSPSCFSLYQVLHERIYN